MRAAAGGVPDDEARLESLAVRAGPSSGAPAGLSPACLACARRLPLGYASTRAEDPERDRALLEQALHADPSLEEAYECLVVLLSDGHDWKRAEAVYDRAVPIDPGYAALWVGRACVRAEQGLELGARGLDPGAAYTGALADASRAAPGRPSRRTGRGSAPAASRSLRPGRARPPSVRYPHPTEWRTTPMKTGILADIQANAAPLRTGSGQG